MASPELEQFWESQFPTNEERREMAHEDEEIKRALIKTSPRERVVAGDDLLALERLAAEKFGLDTLETSRLLEEFWGLRDQENRNYYDKT